MNQLLFIKLYQTMLQLHTFKAFMQARKMYPLATINELPLRNKSRKYIAHANNTFSAF